MRGYNQSLGSCVWAVLALSIHISPSWVIKLGGWGVDAPPNRPSPPYSKNSKEVILIWNCMWDRLKGLLVIWGFKMAKRRVLFLGRKHVEGNLIFNQNESKGMARTREDGTLLVSHPKWVSFKAIPYDITCVRRKALICDLTGGNLAAKTKEVQFTPSSSSSSCLSPVHITDQK